MHFPITRIQVVDKNMHIYLAICSIFLFQNFESISILNLPTNNCLDAKMLPRSPKACPKNPYITMFLIGLI